MIDVSREEGTKKEEVRPDSQLMKSKRVSSRPNAMTQSTKKPNILFKALSTPLMRRKSKRESESNEQERDDSSKKDDDVGEVLKDDIVMTKSVKVNNSGEVLDEEERLKISDATMGQSKVL